MYLYMCDGGLLERAAHGQELIRNMAIEQLKTFSAIVIVSGDGLVHEVILDSIGMVGGVYMLPLHTGVQWLNGEEGLGGGDSNTSGTHSWWIRQCTSLFTSSCCRVQHSINI